MAQVTDSIYYPDILDVQLVRVQNGSEIQSIPLTRFIGPDKVPGFFPVSPNILYKTNGEQIFGDSEYIVRVLNTQTGNRFSAETPVVDSITISRPTANQTISWVTDPFTARYNTAPDGFLYNLTIRFHFVEEIAGSNNPQSKYIDWNYATDLISNPVNTNQIEKDIEGEDFCKFVGQKLDPVPNMVRTAGGLDFIVSCGAKVMADYIRINQSISSVLTSIPNYTNVENGTGIFSSRFISRRLNVQLSTTSKQQLEESPYTSDLGFQ
jgi:hypothetical protein